MKKSTPKKKLTLAAVLEHVLELEAANAALKHERDDLQAESDARFLQLETMLFHERELKAEVERLQIQRRSDEALLHKLQAEIQRLSAENTLLKDKISVAAHGVGASRNKFKVPSWSAIWPRIPGQ